MQRWGTVGRKASCLPHHGFELVNTQLPPTALCWGRLWTLPVPGPRSRSYVVGSILSVPNLPWEDQQHCTSPWVQFPEPFHPKAVPARSSPPRFGCSLSSPALLVQRACKQLEDVSPTCFQSENSAGTPMLALQLGTLVSTDLNLPAQWGAWLGWRKLQVWRRITETGTRENLWAEGETL